MIDEVRRAGKDRFGIFGVDRFMGRNRTRAPFITLPLDPRSGMALHAQIIAQLRRAILERRLGAGTYLPSSRLLASELGCARGTVLAAFEHLASEGYILSVPGSGTVVAHTLPDDAMITLPMKAGMRPVVDAAVRLSREANTALAASRASGHAGVLDAFALGRPSEEAFPFRLWARLLEDGWRRPGRDLGAQHPFGHAGLRRAIATHLGAFRSFACTMEQVVVTSGVRHGMRFLARLLLDPGELAWVEEPGFAGTRRALEQAGVRLAFVPVDGKGFSTKRAEQIEPHARLAVVTPAHQFPLGMVMPLPRRLALLEWADRVGGWVIEDDYDGEYRYAGQPLPALHAFACRGRVVYCGSFSKVLFPALRLSYLVLPPSLVEPASRLLGMAGPAEASLLGQAALARFIEDGHFAAHLRFTRRLYSERQDALLRAAERHLAGLLEVAPDAGGMHLVGWPHPELAAQDFDDRLATNAAMEAGVAVVPLSATYHDRTRKGGLLLGYAAVRPGAIETAAARLGLVLRAYSFHRQHGCTLDHGRRG